MCQNVCLELLLAQMLVFRCVGHSLHCTSMWWWGDFTAQCPDINSQPVGAKIGRGDQVPSLWLHDTVLVGWAMSPLTLTHTQQLKTHCSTLLSSFLSLEVEIINFLDLGFSWLGWIFTDLQSYWFFCFFRLINSPATAPGRRKTLLSSHVSCTSGNARAQGVPGQGKMRSSAPHQGVHPRRWVTQRAGTISYIVF